MRLVGMIWTLHDRYEVLTVVYMETAVLGDVMSGTLVQWTEFQQNHDENRGRRTSIMLINSLPVIWHHTPEDSTRQTVTIRSLPSWWSSYIPIGLVQVGLQYTNMVNYICIHKTGQLKSIFPHTLEPKQSQHDHPAVCAIDQQYSSAALVLLCLLPQGKIQTTYGERLYSYDHTFIICLRVCVLMPRKCSLSLPITMQYTQNF